MESQVVSKFNCIWNSFRTLYYSRNSSLIAKILIFLSEHMIIIMFFIKLLCFWWYFIGGKRTVNTLLKQNSSIFVELQPTTWTFLLLWQSWERLETIFTSSLSSHGYFFYGIEILFTLITTIRTSLSLIFRFSIQFRHFILCFKLSKTI